MPYLHRAKEHYSGFTLIELLIVIAIIAILALIAIPNFLEAQTRSKIARARADMRTVATALEAYFIDYNGYPTGWWGSVAPNIGLLATTTPVAYLTKIPGDVFLAAGEMNRFFFYFSVPYPPDSTGYWGSFRRDYAAFMMKGTYNSSNTTFAESWAPEGTPGMLAVRWQLRTLGPDLVGDFSWPYDPTNGTISRGDISVYGPGTITK